jgi:hypothetical protein
LVWAGVVLAALAASPAPSAVRADDPPPPALTPLAAARKENVERLGKELRKLCASPRAAKEREQIDADLDSLVALGGADAANEMLGALAFDDEATEKKVFAFVETVRDKSLVKPLAAMIEDKDTRRRFRLHGQIAHAFAAIGDVSALEPLAKLIDSEDPTVVAATADALVAFKSAPHAKRVEPVKQLLEVFESTWNLKESRRPEDRIQTEVARGHWEVYGASCRKALQALTGQNQFTRPREFRDWWNEHKKATNW